MRMRISEIVNFVLKVAKIFIELMLSMFMFDFRPWCERKIKEHPEWLISQLLNSGSMCYTNRKEVLWYIQNGWIGRMKNDIKEISIDDPTYVPKEDEQFTLYDGMLGSQESYICKNGKLEITQKAWSGYNV